MVSMAFPRARSRSSVRRATLSVMTLLLLLPLTSLILLMLGLLLLSLQAKFESRSLFAKGNSDQALSQGAIV